MKTFLNRTSEIERIRKTLGQGKFGYVTGRRRIGKTATLLQACQRFGGLYHQAIEGTASQQLMHLTEEWSSSLPILREIKPRTWPEFFALLSKEKSLPRLLVFDEFPYWTLGDSSLSSVVQRWVDHELPRLKTSVLVSGSSQSMLYSQFLNHSSPLYGRAAIALHLQPMSYLWFCKALGYRSNHPQSFARFSVVGGVPHYWNLMPGNSFLKQVQELYFEPSAILAEEPIHMIRDEGITGTLPKAILDLIGRGVNKPGEIASRLGVPHGNLSRPLALLVELGFVHREFPFGESVRSTKKILYSIKDPALSFYYGVHLSVRSRWPAMTAREKSMAIHRHVAHQWENFCRRCFPGSGRYWEGQAEIDVVAHDKGKRSYLVGECKWVHLTKDKEAALLSDLRERFSKTNLRHKLKKFHFRIFSQKDLPWLAKRENTDEF